MEHIYVSDYDWQPPIDHCRHNFAEIGIVLGELLGCGDNGCVYVVLNRPHTVAKIHMERNGLAELLSRSSAVPIGLPQFYVSQRVPNCVDRWGKPVYVDVREDLTDFTSNPLLKRWKRVNDWIRALDSEASEAVLRKDLREAYMYMERAFQTDLALPPRFSWITDQLLDAFRWLVEHGAWIGDLMPDNLGTRGGKSIVIRDV